MNTSIRKLAGIAAIVLLMVSTNSVAQRGMNQNFDRNIDKPYGCERVPDLTEEQQQKIKDLRIAHLDEMQKYRNQMGELRAQKRTLMTGDDVKQSDIDANIDAHTALQNKMMKASAKHQREIRVLLTDEQKVFFDQMAGHRKGYRGHRSGMREGRKYDRADHRGMYRRQGNGF